jgi:ammonia channel protein AmtB
MNIPTTEEDSDGGDPEQGDIAFVLISAALVLLMIPGLGFFYAGLTRVSSALSLILISFWSIALVSLQVMDFKKMLEN